MSDFDKEAEREKLRKKFEEEEERRETTQQMSELLLKGATMMNVHCADCAAPIFRHNGEEFCPTCQRPAEELTIAGPGDVTGPGTPSPETEEPESTDGATEVAPDEPAEIEVEGTETAQEPESQAEPEPDPEPELDTEPTPQTAEASADAPTTEPSTVEGTTPSFDASQEQAVESLSAAIAQLSERAAAADDPRQAQELLAAANEAAEVLQVLRN